MMTPPRSLAAAMARLTAALDHLEAAVERRARPEAHLADLDEQLRVMQDDRARLASELDGALARSRALAQANDEVARRLQRAGAAIRALLPDEGVEPDAQDDAGEIADSQG